MNKKINILTFKLISKYYKTSRYYNKDVRFF